MKIGDKIKLISIKGEQDYVTTKHINCIGKITGHIVNYHSDPTQHWVEIKWNDNSDSNVFIKNIELVKESNNMKLDKEFINKFKNEKIAINVETEQEWLDFCNKSKEVGLNIDNLSNVYHVYGKKSCINCEEDNDYKFSDMDYYKKEGYKIIKYKELIKQQLTLSNIKERWLVQFANGEEAIKNGDKFEIIKDGKYKGGCYDSRYYNEDLTRKARDEKSADIVKVLKPKYEEVWTRPVETVVEMTVEQICKELGKTIKIVK